MTAFPFAVAASPSPSPTEAVREAATTGFAIAGVMVLAVLLTLGLAWAAKVRRVRYPPPRDASKPFAEP